MSNRGQIFSSDHSHCESSKTDVVNRRGTNSVSRIVGDVLRSPGKPLDPQPRQFLESRLHFDFSRVRIHDDSTAAKSARAINSFAYTAGEHIAFASGQYNPYTNAGLGLLAHELAHVAQQSHGAPAKDSVLSLGNPGGAAEQNAEHITHAAAAGHRLPAVQNHPAQVMRATRTYALTFDDGPHTAELGKGINRTEKVLDTLKSKSIQAGFFIQTGVSYRGDNPVGRTLVARMQAEGHVVGIHTGGKTDHELHTEAQKAGRLEGELESAKQYIKAQTGNAPTLVRPPTGKFDKAVEGTYKKAGLTNLLWDVDGDQGKNLPLSQLKARIETGINTLSNNNWKASTPSNPKLVWLYHDIQKGTADNLGTIIDHISKTTTSVTKGADSASFAAP